MSEVKWIKITTNMFDDEKIKLIEAMPDRDAVLIIWVKLLSQAGKCNASGHLVLSENIPYTDEMLSTIFNRPLNTVRMALGLFKKYEMIDYNEEVAIKISNWEKHQNIEGLDKIREQGKLRKQKQREKEKQLLLVSCDTSRDVTQQNKNKNKKENKTLCVFFENLWSIYPNKKSKNKISDASFKKLNAEGEERIAKAIKNYIQEIKENNTEKKYIKHGSTFFNGGYVDYLDENYSKSNVSNEFQMKKPIIVVEMKR